MSTKSKKRRLENLYKKNPRCYWCGCEVKMFNDQDERDKSKRGATLDHVFSKLNPRRLLRKKGTLVLSCRQCNQDREVKESSQLTLEELWKRSGRYAQWM